MIFKLEPKTLQYLTQSSDVNITERFFAEVIYLGIHDSEENYREASEEEKIQWEEELKNSENNI